MSISPDHHRPRKAASRRLWPVLVIATGAVLACAMGVRAWSHWLAQPLMVKACSTARGEQSEVQLDDGSRLRLDGATRLEVRYYPTRREVTLFDGQALFVVQEDDDRPFQVRAGPVRATATGARFAVRHAPDAAHHEQVRVAVEQGRVRVDNVTAKSDDHAVQLTPGQQVWGTVHGVSAVSQLGAADLSPWLDPLLP